MKVVLQLSDPWALGEALGWPRISATVTIAKDDTWLAKIDDPFEFDGTEYRFIVVSPRHEGKSLSDASTGTIPCSMTRISTEHATSPDPCDLSSWHGGHAMIGTVKVDHGSA